MTTVPKWAPYLLLCILGHCLVRSVDGYGWYAWVEFCVWCVCAWATVSAVVDHMRIQHKAAIWRGIPR